ncbi:unnamed protein product, partial [marine sediment metagenome]
MNKYALEVNEWDNWELVRDFSDLQRALEYARQ